MRRPKPPKKKDNLRTAGRLSGLAMQMGLTIYLGNVLGAWIAKKYGYAHAEELLTFAAIIMAMYLMIRQAMQINK